MTLLCKLNYMAMCNRMDLDILTVLMSDNKYYGDSDICIIEK